jgi:hypothetical protein
MKRQVSDRLFFARNPDRRYRFRRPFPGELASLQSEPPAGFIGSVLVEQFAPGIRTRNPITHTTWPCSILRRDETYLGELATLIRSNNPGAADVATRVHAALNAVAYGQKAQP